MYPGVGLGVGCGGGFFVLVVGGCHRSGTSLVAGCLSVCGWFPGVGLLGGQVDNPRGFFECGRVVGVNDWLLGLVGGSWCVPRVVSGVGVGRVRGEVGWLEGVAGGGCWGFKDPRFCLTWRVWLEACPGLRVVEVRRSRGAVAASLRAREGWSLGRCLGLVDAYRDASVGWPSVVVTEFEGWLEDPGFELERVLDAVGLGDSVSEGDRLRAVAMVDASLQHHR